MMSDTLLQIFRKHDSCQGWQRRSCGVERLCMCSTNGEGDRARDVGGGKATKTCLVLHWCIRTNLAARCALMLQGKIPVLDDFLSSILTSQQKKGKANFFLTPDT